MQTAMLEKLAIMGKNSLRRRNFLVMAEKLLIRLREKPQARPSREITDWCRAHAESCDAFLESIDPALWREAQEACRTFETAGRKKLAALDLDLGGGGNYPLLYFFTRRLKPVSVVETGVAAGWSSQAILAALAKNEEEKIGGGGILYSSDFPYFRYPEPEKLIGFVVDDSLKKNWRLFIDGDRANLPRIMKDARNIGLFHYDSDKSYSGRQFALDTVEKSLAENAVIIFDDIQDNFHFRDFVIARGCPFKVFEFNGKYIGFLMHNN